MNPKSYRKSPNEEDGSETLLNMNNSDMNQSDTSRKAPSLLEDVFDIKNCRLEFTSKRQN